ncbi:major head protein [Streptomyces phage TP1604]|uniref:Major capsid hexamer protein n=2 Tax=Woodruffvirus TP1604 TaxID=1982746 RepID=A0A1P8VW05_9CAUD|nr:major head protein [Streptomyces phage TP1604]AKA61751.1 major capsid hexamer protein [Streptomyces phage TP1604]APZ82181.1 major capsid hexamer protein [Streptomyces phage BabyGotBac]USH45388.1 major capsid protein [Streptomyces phage Asis]
MAEMYNLPEDVTALTDDELDTNLAAAVKSFSTVSQTTVVTPQTLPNLRTLKASIQTLKDERASRTAAAEAAAAEIDALTADVFGDESDDVAASAETEDTEAAPEAEATTEAAPAEVIEPTEVVTASGVRRTSLNLAAVRAKQAGTGTGMAKYLAPDVPEGIEIVASVDVPGFRPGEAVDLKDITDGVMRRATGLKTAGGGTGLVASYRLPFPEDMVVKDSSSAPEGSTVLMRAADQRRLDGGDLVASGGWCAPSETVYDITDIACPDMLWDLPEIQINRGGLRFFRTPALDVAALTFVHTEQDDIAGNTKPCFEIPCPAPIDVRAEAVGVCLSSGILTQRFFPELIDWYVRNAMVAHEIRIKTEAYDSARAAIIAAVPTRAVTVRASFAAFSAVYEAVALQAADMIERYNLCDSTQLEVVFPWWTRNLFLSDLARQEGVRLEDLDAGRLEAAFARLGVRVQWARGLAPAVPTDIGGTTLATTWPDSVEFMIYPAGNYQLGRGPEVNLGVIIDSVTVATNDEKIFSEEAVMLVDRLGLARLVTVDVCPNGEVGARNTVDICAVTP